MEQCPVWITTGAEPRQSRARDLGDHGLLPHAPSREFSEALRGLQTSTGPELEALFHGCKNQVWESKPWVTQIARSAGFQSPYAPTDTWAGPASSAAAPEAMLNGEQMLHNNHAMHVAISRVSQTMAKENIGLFYFLHPQSHTGPLSQAPTASSRWQVAKDISSLFPPLPTLYLIFQRAVIWGLPSADPAPESPPAGAALGEDAPGLCAPWESMRCHSWRLVTVIDATACL